MSRAIPPLPHAPQWRVAGQLYFTVPNVSVSFHSKCYLTFRQQDSLLTVTAAATTAATAATTTRCYKYLLLCVKIFL
jgi:hypothetical protein